MKIYVLLLLSVMLSASEYPFEVSNSTMGDIYFNIFNGISAIFGSDIYINMLNLIFLISGFYVFTIGVFNFEENTERKQGVKDYFKYMIAASMLMLFFFGSNSTLVIESKDTPDYVCPQSISAENDAYTVKLPGSLAEIFSILNRFGTASTELASSVFSNISNDNSINDSFVKSSMISIGGGVITPTTILSSDFETIFADKEVLSRDIVSNNFGTTKYGTAIESIGGFYHNCIIMNPDNNLAVKINNYLKNTSNIERTLDTLMTEDKIVSYNLSGSIKDSENIPSNKPSQLLITYNNKTSTCQKFWNEVLEPIFNITKEDTTICDSNNLSKITKSDLYTMTKSENLSNFATLSQLTINSAIQNSYGNAVNDSKIINDMNFASNKSIAQIVIEENGQGYYMSKMLPYLENSLRAILYAFFPFVFLSMIMPNGFTVLKTYFTALLWIELWGPTASIMDMFLSYFAIDKFNSTVSIQGLSMLSSPNIVTDSSMLGAVAGYLYAFIPAITYMILSGTAFMLSGMLDKLTSIYSKNMDSESIREDLSRLSYAEKMNKKTNEKMGLAQRENLREMGNAEAESTKDSAYYNSGYGYMKSHELEAKGKTRNTMESIGKGIHSSDSEVRNLASSGEFKSLSQNTTANYMNNIKSKELDKLSSSDAISKVAEYRTENKVAKFNSDKNGVNIDSASGVNSNAEILSNFSSAEKIGDIEKEVVFDTMYKKSHGMNNGKSGIDNLSDMARVHEDMAGSEGLNDFNEITKKAEYQKEIGGTLNNFQHMSKMNAIVTVVKEKADIKAMETVGKKRLEKSMYNENISNAGMGLSLKKGLEDSFNRAGYKKESLYEMSKKLSFMKNSNNLWDSMSKKSMQNSLSSNGITAKETGILDSMSLKSLNVAMNESKKFYDNNLEHLNHRELTNEEAYLEQVKKKSFTDSLDSVVQSKTTKATLDTFGAQESVSASIINKTKDVEHAKIIKDIFRADTYAESGEMLGTMNAVLDFGSLALSVTNPTLRKWNAEAKKIREVKELKKDYKNSKQAKMDKIESTKKKLKSLNLDLESATSAEEKEKIKRRIKLREDSLERMKKDIKVLDKMAANIGKKEYIKSANRELKAEHRKDKLIDKYSEYKKSGLEKIDKMNNGIERLEKKLEKITSLEKRAEIENKINKSKEAIQKIEKNILEIQKIEGKIGEKGFKKTPNQYLKELENKKMSNKLNNMKNKVLSEAGEVANNIKNIPGKMAQGVGEAAGSIIKMPGNMYSSGVEAISSSRDLLSKAADFKGNYNKLKGSLVDFKKASAEMLSGTAKRISSVDSWTSAAKFITKEGDIYFRAMPRGLMSSIKSGGAAFALDYGSNYLYEKVEAGSVAQFELGVVSKGFKIMGEGFSVVVADVIPAIYSGVTGDFEGVKRQWSDVKESMHRVDTIGKQMAADTENMINHTFNGEDTMTTYDLKTENRVVFKEINGEKVVLSISDKNGRNIYTRGFETGDNGKLKYVGVNKDRDITIDDLRNEQKYEI